MPAPGGARARRPGGRARRWSDSRTPILGRAVSSVLMRLSRSAPVVAALLSAALASGLRRSICRAEHGDSGRGPGRAAHRHAGTVDGWPTPRSPQALGLRARALDAPARGRPGRSTPPASRSSAAASSPATGTGAWTGPTPREVFSITKSVTSALVGIAVRDGDLRLDDRVSTLRAAVARHRVGDGHRAQPALQRQRPLLVADVRLHRPAPGPRAARATPSGSPSSTPPASAWAYNNAAIQVLEPVLERATGMRVATFARTGSSSRSA